MTRRLRIVAAARKTSRWSLWRTLRALRSLETQWGRDASSDEFLAAVTLRLVGLP